MLNTWKAVIKVIESIHITIFFSGRVSRDMKVIIAVCTSFLSHGN